MNVQQLRDFRQRKDEFFKTHRQSPLTPEQKKTFNGLNYFDPNPDLDLTVHVEPFDQQDEIIMQTTTGDTQHYTRYGQFTFTADGQQARLTIYEADHSFFLPFVDGGAGKETYGAGRYLEPDQLDKHTFRVDFNQAYNPYCAYNEMWSCPITPPENRLKVVVRAGEKIPTGDWAEQQ